MLTMKNTVSFQITWQSPLQRFTRYIESQVKKNMRIERVILFNVFTNTSLTRDGMKNMVEQTQVIKHTARFI